MNMELISFEKQHILWTEYVAIMTTLNGLLWDDHRHNEKKYNFYKHNIMTFHEFIDNSHYHKYNEIKRYSFLEEKHYDFKLLKLETEKQWYNKL